MTAVIYIVCDSCLVFHMLLIVHDGSLWQVRRAVVGNWLDGLPTLGSLQLAINLLRSQCFLNESLDDMVDIIGQILRPDNSGQNPSMSAIISQNSPTEEIPDWAEASQNAARSEHEDETELESSCDTGTPADFSQATIEYVQKKLGMLLQCFC